MLYPYSPELERRMQQRSEAVFREMLTPLQAQTDRLLAVLMVVQWLAGIIAAIYITPWTWSGSERFIHLHVWAAIFLGGLISALPVFLAWRHPGESITRHTIAIAQMLWSALLIHLTGGRIETHFHVFGSLAFLAFYRDSRVLVTASAVVIIEHLVRGIFWPESVFGVRTASYLRPLEHAAWVIFEVVILYFSIQQSIREIYTSAKRQTELEWQRTCQEEQVLKRTEELGQAYAELEAMHEASPLGMFTTDSQGNFLKGNRRWRELTGVNTEQSIGMSWFKVIHPLQQADFMNFWMRVTNAKNEDFIDVRLNTSDDKAVWVHFRVAPMTRGGQLVGHVGIVEDITFRKQAENAIDEARVAAEKANKAKSEFLTNVSHELRTPMTAILGFTEVLVTTPLDTVQSDYVGVIERNGQYLLTLINDILDLARLESGRLTIENGSCQPAVLAAEVVALMRVPAESKKIALELELEELLPDTIVTDPKRLRQVLINLLGNAVKFTEVGKVELRVRRHGDRLEFIVSDTGIGISEEQLRHVFEPFTQGDSSLARRFGGTGLGLAICKQFLEAMGGEIHVHSKKGESTTFTVVIPLTTSRESEDVPCPVQPQPLLASGTNVPLTGHRILLAEDGLDLQRILSFWLRKAGATVEVAENGAIAIDFATSRASEGQEYDIILMDMQMPVMDGYQATKILRQNGVTTPVVALTAHAMVGDREKCLDGGCNDYASKPISRDRLLSLVESHSKYRSRPEW